MSAKMDYVNYGGGYGHDLISPETFLIGSLVIVVFFLFIRSWAGRPSIFQDGGEYALHMGLVLFLSTLWHFWYGEASILFYTEAAGFSWGDMDTWYFIAESGQKSSDLGFEGLFINTYEITVTATFLIFGIIVPTLLFPLDVYTGPAETNIRFWSALGVFFYGIFPALLIWMGNRDPNGVVTYFQIIDITFLIPLGILVVVLATTSIWGDEE